MSVLLAKRYDLEKHEQFNIKNHRVTVLDFSECESVLKFIELPQEFVINGIINHYSTSKNNIPGDTESFGGNFVFADEFFINLHGPVSLWGKIDFKSANNKTTASIHHIHIKVEE